MKTTHCRFTNMYFIIFVIFTTLACSKEGDKKKLTIELKYHRTEGQICITLVNNSNKKVFMPKGRGLIGGIRVFEKKQSRYDEITCDFREKVFEFYIQNMERKHKCQLISEKNLLTEEQKNQVCKNILKLNTELINTEGNIWYTIRDIENEILYLNINDSIREYFIVPKEYENRQLIMFYAYPYLTLNYCSCDIKNKDTLKSHNLLLRLKYPREIYGYFLYTGPLMSKPIVIN